MARKSSFKKGAMEMIILILLREKDCYGYELGQMMMEQSGNRISITEGSLYPALYRLIDKGCITSYKKLAGKRLTRIYYHMEPAGEVYLQELIRDYHEVLEGIHEIFSANHIDLDESGNSES